MNEECDAAERNEKMPTVLKQDLAVHTHAIMFPLLSIRAISVHFSSKRSGFIGLARSQGFGHAQQPIDS